MLARDRVAFEGGAPRTRRTDRHSLAAVGDEEKLLATAAAATPHAPARLLFTAFAKRSAEVLAELEEALRDLVHTYDPAIWENRFVIGGTVELLIAAAMRAVDLDVDNVGAKSTEADFDVYASRLRQRISVKSTFRRKENSVRLVNTMGPNEAKAWLKPTIFLVPDLGMVYGDPGFGDLSVAVKATRDALIIGLGAVRTHSALRPQFRVALDVPV